MACAACLEEKGSIQAQFSKSIENFDLNYSN